MCTINPQIDRDLMTPSHTQLMDRYLVKLHKRVNGMMWFMVSALLGITLNVCDVETELSETQERGAPYCPNPTVL